MILLTVDRLTADRVFCSSFFFVIYQTMEWAFLFVCFANMEDDSSCGKQDPKRAVVVNGLEMLELSSLFFSIVFMSCTTNENKVFSHDFYMYMCFVIGIHSENTVVRLCLLAVSTHMRTTPVAFCFVGTGSVPRRSQERVRCGNNSVYASCRGDGAPRRTTQRAGIVRREEARGEAACTSKLHAHQQK